MHHALRLNYVRQLVEATFRDHGAGDDGFVEKILIRDGFYCGRCFLCEGYRAVWFIEERKVKFYGPDGGFLSARSTDETSTACERRVA